jgi:hypothetical protein
MSITAIALVGWIPLTLLLFAMLPPRRAVIISMVAGALFLPEATGVAIPGFDALGFSKAAAVSWSCLLGVLLLDTNRLLSFRPRWFDSFAVALGTTGIVSSLLNGIGFRDGVYEAVIAVWMFTIPYFLGRLYFSDLAGLRELAIGIFIGGLVYAPFCLIENRMSPQLHRWVYNFHQHEFAQVYRFGGFRPMVFMQHGLAVGLFMASATVIGWWLWASRSLTRLWGIPTGWLVAAMFGTTVLVRSGNGYVFLAVGVGLIYATRYLRSALPVVLLCAVPVVYCATRATGLFDARSLVAVADTVFGADRAGSLQFRVNAEDVLAAKAMERPAFGWGGHGRNRVRVNDKDTVTDGLWILTFGKWGVAGLGALIGTLTLGAALLWRRFPAWTWSTPAVGAAAAAAVVAVFHMIDGLPNAMPVGFYYAAAGGAAGLQSLPGVAGALAGAPRADRRPLWQRRLADLRGGRPNLPAATARPGAAVART